jgi:CubicO group peptidase (beta-lactamase class C family)
MKTPITTRALRGVAATIAASALLLAGCGSTNPMAATGNAGAETRAKIEAALRDAMATDHLRPVIVRITANGEDVYTAALGESGDGVPATPDMRFRNGAFAFTYIGHAFARLADAGKVSLDDKLARWFPEMPRADLISLRNLLNMTSGYADYVYQPVISDTLMANPWKQWTDDELLAIGFAAPPMFAPGTNWAYSHTNYIILGKVLEKIGERPLEQVLQEHVIGPMGLTATSNNGRTPTIPEPILRSYSAERGTYEESTFWSPSWTTAQGAVQTTSIHDVTRSMEIVGSGTQVSPDMYAQQVKPNLLGFGSKDLTGQCLPCRKMTTELSYGLGVVLTGQWITQTKNFAGAGASSGYLPSKKLAISVATTYRPAAFKSDGSYVNSSSSVFSGLATIMAPADAPSARPPG